MNSTDRFRDMGWVQQEWWIEGFIEGWAEGYVEGQMDQLLDMLSYKFGLLPDSLIQIVRSADVDGLRVLSRRFVGASSIEEMLLGEWSTSRKLPIGS
ncbi:hypothetical protein NRB56_46640 [Nocardia sp. RB56]|uniref:DUF4351 domain-containing protein n=1 Tax=Nocardia aurantia TaxID=2585199 RepID=A0A7K0DTH7_9NOCA|nr:hypothetical protein [Nocardia aurantia]